MKESYNEKAYREIRQKMLLGELPLGTKLDDAELAKEMGVSRTPVREALIRLSNEGFCSQIPRMGTYVRISDDQELSEMFELRVVLESHAVKKAALHATPENIEELEALCDIFGEVDIAVREISEFKTARLELKRKLITTDIQFHLTIVRIGRNRRFLKIIDDLAIMNAMYSYEDLERPFECEDRLEKAAETYDSHKRIVTALKKKSPELALEALLEDLVPPSPRGSVFAYTGLCI